MMFSISDKRRRVAGGLEESIFQPTWGPDGALYFASDRTGWWNLYRWRAGRATSLCRRKAEFGMPQWALGMTTYAIISATRLVCVWTSRGSWRLGELDAYRDQEVVVHCHHGGRSERVANWLRGQGFAQARTMVGGIDRWAEEIDHSVPRY